MRFELCPAPLNTPAGRLPLPFSHRLGRGGWRSAWLALYNLHGKTREVIPCRNAARLVVALSVQVRGLHASLYRINNLYTFAYNWIPKVSIKPRNEKCYVVCSDNLGKSKVTVRLYSWLFLVLIFLELNCSREVLTLFLLRPFSDSDCFTFILGLSFWPVNPTRNAV